MSSQMVIESRTFLIPLKIHIPRILVYPRRWRWTQILCLTSICPLGVRMSSRCIGHINGHTTTHATHTTTSETIKRLWHPEASINGISSSITK
jgi:hypothetical protein